MRIRISATVERKLRKLFRRRPELARTFDVRVRLFVEDPQHPSLRVHKLKRFDQPTWSIYITADLRMLFIYDEDGILIEKIGTHDEVY